MFNQHVIWGICFARFNGIVFYGDYTSVLIVVFILGLFGLYMTKYIILVTFICLNTLVGPAHAMKRTLEESSTTDVITPTVHELPSDVMVVIFSNLSIRDLFAASFVNKPWHQVVRLAKPDFYGERGLLDTYKKGLNYPLKGYRGVFFDEKMMIPCLYFMSALRDVKNKFNDEDGRYMAKNFAVKHLEFAENQQVCELFSDPRHFMVPAMMIAWRSRLPKSINPYGFFPTAKAKNFSHDARTLLLMENSRLVDCVPTNNVPVNSLITNLLIIELMFRHKESYDGHQTGLTVLFSKLSPEASLFAHGSSDYAILKQIFFDKNAVKLFFTTDGLFNRCSEIDTEKLYLKFVKQLFQREEWQFFIDQWQGFLVGQDPGMTEPKHQWLKVGCDSIDDQDQIFTDKLYVECHELVLPIIKYAAFAHLQLKKFSESAKLYEVYIRAAEFAWSKDPNNDKPSKNVYISCAIANEMLGNYARAQALREKAKCAESYESGDSDED